MEPLPTFEVLVESIQEDASISKANNKALPIFHNYLNYDKSVGFQLHYLLSHRYFSSKEKLFKIMPDTKREHSPSRDSNFVLVT